MSKEETKTRLHSGRPRSEEVKQAIMKATRELLEERGLAGLTIEGVAARAEVGKSTIYRWWSNKTVLAIEAFLETNLVKFSFPRTGSAVEDLHQQLRSLAGGANNSDGNIIASFIVESQYDPEAAEAFRKHYLAAWGEAANEVIGRGIKSGEFRSDLNIPVALNIIYGSLLFRRLAGSGPLDEQYIEELLRIVLPGMLAAPEK